MSLPPPRKYEPAKEVKRGAFWIRGRLALVICSKCKNEQSIAFGSVALEMKNEKVIQLGLALGWQMAPFVLCNFCLPPKFLIYHDASDSLFWSSTNEYNEEVTEVGRSNIPTRAEAWNICKAAKWSVETFQQIYQDITP